MDKIKAAQSDADAISGALKKITINDAMLDQFRTVITTLSNGVNKEAGRFKPINDTIGTWQQKYNNLQDAYKDFEPCDKDSESHATVKRIIDSFKKIKTDADAQFGSNKEPPKGRRELKEAIKSIPRKVEMFLGKQTDGTEGLAGIVLSAAGSAGVDAPQILRTDLPKKLPDLAKALRLRRLFQPIADGLATALNPGKYEDLKGIFENDKAPEFKPLLDEVDSQLKVALTKVVKWAEQAAENAKEEFTAAHNALLQAMRDPFHQATEAAAQATVSDAARKDLAALTAAFTEILSEVQREDIPKGALPDNFSAGIRDLNNKVRILQSMTARLERTVVNLSSDIQLDKSTWTMASVNLFYFDNVERLIRVLSPQYARSIGSDSFQKEARTRREALDQASQALETADQVVSDARTAVGDLREEVRQATLRANAATQAQRKRIEDLQRRANAAEANSRTMEERRKIIENDKVQAEDRYNRAKTASEANSEDADLKNRLIAAQNDLDATESREARAKAEEEKSKQDATAARADADKAASGTNEEVTELKSALTKAETDLDQAEADRKTATAEQRKALQSAFLAAQVENFAFAQARDNAPFWTNFPEPKASGAGGTPAGGTTGTTQPVNYQDSDPINRVLLFAFPDSRTLFIRGQSSDIDLVRQIIKEFDRPEGQAVMTLRTMEVSSDGTSKGTKRALEFLEMMDGEINKAQSQVERALAILRNAINAQVKSAVAEYKAKILDPEQKKLEAQMMSLSSDLAAATDEEVKANLQARLNANSVRRNAIAVRLNMLVDPASSAIMESVAFYDKRVLDDLGWRDDLIGQTVDLSYLNAIIPRPSSTVTLAQALIVLSLATDANRVAILNKTNTDIANEPSKDGEKKNPFSLCALLNIHRKDDKKSPSPFNSVKSFIGDDGNSSDILGFQLKLVEALRFNGVTHVLEAAEALVRADVLLEKEQDEVRKQITQIA
ncbi:MAG TPA: hypothetical protein VJX74_19435, partial [Blastocatellia bacterium]|nr:hypothetical protein [Blastocatellia bacterium]